MKKRFFTSTTFKLFAAFSITLGIFLMPVKVIINPNHSFGVSIQESKAADTIKTSDSGAVQTWPDGTVGLQMVQYPPGSKDIVTGMSYPNGGTTKYYKQDFSTGNPQVITKLDYDANVRFALNQTNPTLENQAASIATQRAVDNPTAENIAAADAAVVAADDAADAADEQGSFLKDPMKFIARGLLGIILKSIAYILLIIRALAGLLLVISAKILDWSLQVSIGFDYTKIGGVSEVWTIVRDIFNVLFVFILLWAGITQIIGTAKVNTKQIIIGVVIAGLLINFSMFFARVLIDTSNIVSTALYNQLVTINGPSVSLTTGLTSGLGIPQVTASGGNAFTANYNAGKTEISSTNITNTIGTFGTIILFILQITIYLVAAFAFFSVFILFIGRIVTLLLLLALSPLGFLGTTAIGELLKDVKKTTDWWWEEFTAQLFVAPIFLLLIFITLKIAHGFGDPTKMNAITDALGKSSQTGGLDPSILFKFAIIIYLILKTVELTKKSSGSVGAAINSIGQKAVGFGLGVATGGGAMMLRGSIGKFASNVAKGNGRIGGALNRAANRGGALGGFAKWTQTGAEKTAGASFDMRNTALGKNMATRSGIDANAGVKVATGGYDGSRKRYDERQTKNAEIASRLTDREKEGVSIKVKDEEMRINAELSVSKSTTSKKEGEVVGLEKFIEALKMNKGKFVTDKDGNSVKSDDTIIKQKEKEHTEKVAEVEERKVKEKKLEERVSGDGKRKAQDDAEKAVIKQKKVEYAEGVESGKQNTPNKTVGGIVGGVIGTVLAPGAGSVIGAAAGATIGKMLRRSKEDNATAAKAVRKEAGGKDTGTRAIDLLAEIEKDRLAKEKAANASPKTSAPINPAPANPSGPSTP